MNWTPERNLDPPEENQCKICGENTDNGSTCESCVEEIKADNK